MHHVPRHFLGAFGLIPAETGRRTPMHASQQAATAAMSSVAASPLLNHGVSHPSDADPHRDAHGVVGWHGQSYWIGFNKKQEAANARTT